jgi:hypothetical protein
MEIHNKKLPCNEAFIYIAQKTLNKTTHVYTKDLYPTSFSFWNEIYNNELTKETNQTALVYFYIFIEKYTYYTCEKRLNVGFLPA